MVVVALYGPFLIAVAVFGLGHLMFPVLLLIVFSILFGLLGADYGLPGLFWHDRLLTRMGAATAVTLLLALSGVLAFYTAKPTAKTLDTLLVRAAPTLAEQGEDDDLGRLVQFLLVTSPPFLALLAGARLVSGRLPAGASLGAIDFDQPG